MARFVDRSAVRTQGRRARRAVQGDARVRAEAMLGDHLRSLHALDAASVGVFFAQDGEPDLMPLVEYLWDRGRTVALPVVNLPAGNLPAGNLAAGNLAAGNLAAGNLAAGNLAAGNLAVASSQSEPAGEAVTTDSGPKAMRFVPWFRDDALVRGRFDIPVPPNDQTIEPETVLVSFTGFDARGNRMGRGAGFFDRYLATSAANIVGVGFETQRFEAIPIEPHDIALPVIVTDLGVRFVA